MNMENLERNEQENNLMTINLEIQNYLKETSKWSKFLAIIGYVGIGLILIMAIVVMIGFSNISNIYNSGFPMSIFGIIYILIAVLYYFPVTYLYKFSININQGLNSNNSESITYGFQNLKSLFKFMGISTVVVISLYGLFFLFSIPIAGFS